MEFFRGKVKVGSRGGLYFEIKEAGKVVMVGSKSQRLKEAKVYLPRTEANIKRYSTEYY